MNDEKLLTLCGRSCSEGGSDLDRSTFAHRRGREYDDGLPWLYSPSIIQDALPIIVDAPLTLISRWKQSPQ